jgi:hypothetical protein
MKNKGKSASLGWPLFLGFAFLYLVQAAPGLWLNSLTNDEPLEITNGYFALTQGDVAAAHQFTPFASTLNAIPLLALCPKVFPFTGDVLDRAHSFLFIWNLKDLIPVTVAARLVSLLLGLGIGWILFRVTRHEVLLAAAVLSFWALDPTLLALSGLAKSDMPAACFFLLAVFLFQKNSRGSSLWNFFLTGVVVALAVNCKFSCFVLLPVFVALELFEARNERRKTFFATFLEKETVQKWGWGFVGFGTALCLIYLPATIHSPEHRWPISYFFKTLHEAFLDQRHYPVYFCGQSGFENHWYYFPVAFVLKSPLPLIFCFLAAVGLASTGRLKIPAWQWVPPLFFILAIFLVLNEGVRFLAPALPFVLLIAARGVAWVWAPKNLFGKKGKYVVMALLGWQALSVIPHFPQYLSYFNDLITPERKFFYLADSNLDWSQDHKRLVHVAQQRGWKKVKLAYLGATDPSVYGLNWEPWQEEDLKGPRPGVVYAVNASFFQLAPAFYPSTRKIAEGWMTEALPSGKIADSWYYFETPGQAKTVEKGNWLGSVPFLQYRKYAFPLE